MFIGEFILAKMKLFIWVIARNVIRKLKSKSLPVEQTPEFLRLNKHIYFSSPF